MFFTEMRVGPYNLGVDKTVEPKQVSKYIIIYELILGAFELISCLGILLYGERLLQIYYSLSRTELIQDPNDLTIQLTEKIIPGLFSQRMYIALLLLVFGAVKIVSGIGLIYKKTWAEHLLIVFLILVIPFEILRLIDHFSLGDLIYLIIDAIIVAYLIRLHPIAYFQRLSRDLK